MNPKLRKIEIDARTAELLEARAAARGMTVSQLLADLMDAEEALSPALVEMREAARGPWAPEVLAEDARRLAEFQRTREAVPWDEVKAWMQSWGTANELPPPKPRKL
jgi:predicted transcriptional regulator